MSGRQDNVAAQVFTIGALFNSLIHADRRNGVLSEEEIDNIFDEALTGLEQAEGSIADQETKQVLSAARREVAHLFPARRHVRKPSS
jgi:hypothetical protein